MALEIKVTLRVYSKKLSLSELTENLGEPSRGFSIGDLYSQRKKTRKHSYWELHSSISRKVGIDDHLKEILDFVESKESIILKLKKDECDIDLSCFFDSGNGQGGAIISHKTIKRLSKFDLDLAFDVYADCE